MYILISNIIDVRLIINSLSFRCLPRVTCIFYRRPRDNSPHGGKNYTLNVTIWSMWCMRMISNRRLNYEVELQMPAGYGDKSKWAPCTQNPPTGQNSSRWSGLNSKLLCGYAEVGRSRQSFILSSRRMSIYSLGSANHPVISCVVAHAKGMGGRQ